MLPIDIAVRHHAERQHGLITSRQTRALGMHKRQLAHRTATGSLEWITPRVLRVPGSPPTPQQELLTAVLDAGRHAALSHTTALAHWGVRGFVIEPLHVIRRRDVDDHALERATLHEVRFLPASEVRTLEGIPVVSPSLGLLQLAGTRCTLRRLGAAIDAAWSDRLVTYSTLVAIDRLMSRQGRPGLRAFRALVEERGPGYVPPASNLEGRFAQILERAGRPPMQRQVDTSSEEGWIGRVDFRDRVLPVIAEVQSERFHRGLTAENADHRRLTALRDAGFEVVEVTDADLFHRADAVVEAIDAARARAASRRAA